MRNPEIRPTFIEGGIEFYRNKDAQAYTGLSPNGLYDKVKKFNVSHPNDPIEKISFGEGSKGVYYKKNDLDRLFEMRIAE